MLNIIGIFKNKVPNVSRLLEFGFVQVEQEYIHSYGILNDQFRMNIKITAVGIVSVNVWDTDTKEEYILINLPMAVGAFVGSMIQACEEKLKIIAENCFDHTVFKSDQAKQIITYVNETYQDHLEFLWEKFSQNAVLRRKDSRKWYAAILTVGKAKLGLEGTELIEVIDLHALPSEIEQLLDGKKYFPGYHMNKKHWYTICLNGSVPTQEICERIDASYLLAKK